MAWELGESLCRSFKGTRQKGRMPAHHEQSQGFRSQHERKEEEIDWLMANSMLYEMHFDLRTRRC